MSAAIADAVLDANYEGPHGADAEYFAPGAEPAAGTGLGCRAMRGGSESGLEIGGFTSRPSLDTETLRLRVWQVPAPASGGHLLLTETGDLYCLTAQPERFDRARREWTCTAIQLGS